MIRTDWLPSHAAPRPVAVVRLNRADKKNAMTPAMLDDLCSALTTASQKAAAVVLAGAGSTFCSGFDLSLCKDDSRALADLLTGLSSVIRLMRDVRAPIVAAAHGAAIAGGCALLAGADIVVTHAECKFGYPVVRLGISPAVNAPFLAQAIGHGPTRDKLLGGQIFSGSEAFRLGLAHTLSPTAEQVPELASTFAAQLAAKPACGLIATKNWLNELDGAAAQAKPALQASLNLVGSPEERHRLQALWS
ncbi:MAG: enoyl-CoA hydratase/isomerase family protein [Phycisphaerales bacterium]|nr:enoyl-CoA hydratase/isomerase family protein [Phycisphaerales bacterium]